MAEKYLAYSRCCLVVCNKYIGVVMRLYKGDKSSDMNGQRWLVVRVTHFISGHETLQRYILVVMVKSVMKDNSKCL